MKNALYTNSFPPLKNHSLPEKKISCKWAKIKGWCTFWTCLSYNRIKTKQTEKKLMKEKITKIATAFLDSIQVQHIPQISSRWRWQHNRQMKWVKSANFVLYFYGSCLSLLFREGEKRTLIAKGNGLSGSAGVVKKTSVWPFFFFYFGNA